MVRGSTSGMRAGVVGRSGCCGRVVRGSTSGVRAGVVGRTGCCGVVVRGSAGRVGWVVGFSGCCGLGEVVRSSRVAGVVTEGLSAGNFSQRPLVYLSVLPLSSFLYTLPARSVK